MWQGGGVQPCRAPFRIEAATALRSRETGSADGVAECFTGRCECKRRVLDFESQLTLSIGRRQMRRGESKAKDLKRGGGTRSVAAKPKTRAVRKEASAATLAEKLSAKTRE